ncbi:MAG: hypothetical protein CO170_02230 [candidate division SR1 bacterium CG_4_9_14_3_um_filter_40_9]|nr:MAG: hypothetical protein CO170_02230 [candidate division SR1 bacterium CG_4_9_14_3_um_filter_40_9]
MDNYSTDDTVKQIQSFNDSRIQLFQSEKNLGPYGGCGYKMKKYDIHSRN